MKIDRPTLIRITIGLLGALSAAIAAVQDVLASGQPTTTGALVMSAGAAALGYAMKPPGTVTTAQATQQASDAVRAWASAVAPVWHEPPSLPPLPGSSDAPKAGA